MGELTLPDLTLEETFQVLVAAFRYFVSGALEFGMRRVSVHLRTSPLAVYFIASRYRWYGKARIAAVNAVRTSDTFDMTNPIMENANSRAYYSFLKFRHHYIQAFFLATPTPHRVPVQWWQDAAHLLKSWMVVDESISSAYSPEAIFHVAIQETRATTRPGSIWQWLNIVTSHDRLVRIQDVMSKVTRLISLLACKDTDLMEHR